MSEEAIVTIIVAVLGSQGLWAAIQAFWNRKKHAVSTQEVDRLLQPLQEKLDHDYQRMEGFETTLTQIQQAVYRQCLMASPRDRNAHESALEYGERYLQIGGNGPGHVRYEQLVDDYRRRLESNDWDYSTRHV